MAGARERPRPFERSVSFMAGSLRLTLCTGLSQGGITHYSYCLASALQASGVAVDQLIYSTPEYDLRAYPHSQRLLPYLQLAVSRRTKLTSPVQNLAVMLGSALRSDVVHFQWSLGQRP